LGRNETSPKPNHRAKFQLLICKGPFIKDVRTPEGRGLSSADKGSSSDADVRTFICKKLLFFFEISVRMDKGRGVNFSRFCADVLYGRSLREKRVLKKPWP